MQTVRTHETQEHRRHGANGPDIGHSPRDVPQLLTRLGKDSAELLRTEAELARAEVRESIADIKKGTASLVTSSVVLLSGLIILLMAGVYGLGIVLPLWASALIVGGAVTLIGGIAAAGGAAKLRKENLKPDRTVREARRDVRMAKEQLS